MAFRFKQFRVQDELSSMKVGTDAVLLGAWAGHKKIENILDVGTGCGVLALMMAQRFKKAKVLGIDIHPGSARQAAENFRESPWPDRLHAQEISLQDLSGTVEPGFDLIVSNPPFFKDSLLPPDPSRELARHTRTLSYEELLVCSRSLLTDGGSLALILPFEEKSYIAAIMKENNLFLMKEMDIIPVRGKEPNRFLSEWGNVYSQADSGEMTIRTDPSTYSEEYKDLTREFYLAL